MLGGHSRPGAAGEALEKKQTAAWGHRRRRPVVPRVHDGVFPAAAAAVAAGRKCIRTGTEPRKSMIPRLRLRRRYVHAEGAPLLPA